MRPASAAFAVETPFAFYAWLLGGDGGRARILKRLGHEATDALDEFLELALGYERKAPASLQGFMAWLRAADTEVKRDMEISRDEVRVMTVHGAKGLEAPVVFLVDTTTSPSDTQRLRLINLPQGNAAPHAPGVVVWAGRKAEDPAGVAAARAAMLGDTEDEYRRLLYVAMTRAADRLIVGGCMPGNMEQRAPISWYDLIDKGLANSGLELQEFETAGGKVKRYSRPEDGAAPRQRRGGSGDDRADRTAVMAAHAGAAGGSRRQSAAPFRSRRRRRPSGPNRRIARAARPRAAARHAGASAAAIAARPRPATAAARPRWAISPAMPPTGPRPSARRWRKACWL